MQLIKEKYLRLGAGVIGDADKYLIRQVYDAMRELYQPENVIGYTQANEKTKPTIYFRTADLAGHCTLEHTVQTNIGFGMPYRGIDYQGENKDRNGVMHFYEYYPRINLCHGSRSHIIKVSDVKKVDLHKKAMEAFEGKLILTSHAVEQGVKYASMRLLLT